MESQESGAPNGQRDEGARRFSERVEKVGDTAQQAWTRTRDAITDMKGTLDIDGRVRRSPYGTVGAALGIGYVLGGGLFSPLTARILGLGLRIGMRLAVLPLLTEELSGFAEALGGGGGSAEVGEGAEGGGKGRGKAKSSNTNKGRQP
jgi:hypothetical protein